MIQYRTAIRVRALGRAKDAVKALIRAHGLKPNHRRALALAPVPIGTRPVCADLCRWRGKCG